MECMNRACDEQAYCTGLCKACYSRLRYWLNKQPSDIARRRHQLARSEATIATLLIPAPRMRKHR